MLLDAPCSSERHLIHKLSELSNWSSGRSKANAERQLSLLVAAFRLCRTGGRVVYSTCSLSNLENDGVVAKAMKKFNKAASSGAGGRGGRRDDGDDDGGDDDSDDAEMVVYPLNESNMPFGEKTEFGWHILPDRAEGWGPIYLCAFDKVFKS